MERYELRQKFYLAVKLILTVLDDLHLPLIRHGCEPQIILVQRTEMLTLSLAKFRPRIARSSRSDDI